MIVQFALSSFMLYFFPSGYMEQCVIHVAYRKGEHEVDSNEPPYVLTCNAFEGTASVESGEGEAEIKDRDDA